MSSVITLSDARFCFLSLCTGKQATLTCTQGIKMLLLCNTRSQSPSVGSRRGLFGLQNKFFIVWGHRLVFFFSLCSQSLVTPAETNPVVVSLYSIASSCDISFFYRPILLQSCFLYDSIDSLKYKFCLALMLIARLQGVSDCCCIWKHFNWFSIVILCQDTSIRDIIITIHRVSSESRSLCTAPCCLKNRRMWKLCWATSTIYCYSVKVETVICAFRACFKVWQHTGVLLTFLI